jgi:membrane-associated protein
MMDLIAAISIKDIIDMFLHLDKTLQDVVSNYHQYVYLLLFGVIFCETGLVVTPFLPGDSLLFAAGSIAAMEGAPLDVRLVFIIMTCAAILGDSTNYWIGRFIGPKVFHTEKTRFLNKKHLDKTHAFYERHGGKTVVIARFMPIIRTFAPFVAGIGKMNYLRFLAFSVGGTLCWMSCFVLGGYYFGNTPFVKKNFTAVIMAIIVISLLPAVIGFINTQLEARKARKNGDTTRGV